MECNGTNHLLFIFCKLSSDDRAYHNRNTDLIMQQSDSHSLFELFIGFMEDCRHIQDFHDSEVCATIDDIAGSRDVAKVRDWMAWQGVAFRCGRIMRDRSLLVLDWCAVRAPRRFAMFFAISYQ